MRILAHCLTLGCLLALAPSATAAPETSPAPAAVASAPAAPVSAAATPFPGGAQQAGPGAICPVERLTPSLGAPKTRPLDGLVDCGNCPGDDRQCNRICWARGECEYSCEADATTCELVSCTCLPC